MKTISQKSCYCKTPIFSQFFKRIQNLRLISNSWIKPLVTNKSSNSKGNSRISILPNISIAIQEFFWNLLYFFEAINLASYVDDTTSYHTNLTLLFFSNDLIATLLKWIVIKVTFIKEIKLSLILATIMSSLKTYLNSSE